MAPGARPGRTSAPRSAPSALLLLLLLCGCKLFDPCRPVSGSTAPQGGEMSVLQSGCASHDDCPSKICEQGEGENRVTAACRDPAQVLLVDANQAACSGPPTQIVPPEPFCTIQAAIDYALRTYSGAAAIRVLSKVHAEHLTLDGSQSQVTRLALYGPVRLTPKDPQPLIRVRHLEVQLAEVELVDGPSVPVHALLGVDCAKQSQLRMWRGGVSGMRFVKGQSSASGRGISATDDCKVVLDRVLLADNQAEALWVESSRDALISNSILKDNGSSKPVMSFVNTAARVLLSTVTQNRQVALDGQGNGDVPAISCGSAEVHIQDSIVVGNRQRPLEAQADLAQSLGPSQFQGACKLSDTTVIGASDAWPGGLRVTPKFTSNPSGGAGDLPVLEASDDTCACCTNKALTCAGFSKASPTAHLHDEAPRDYFGTLRPCVGADVGAYEAP